MAEQASAEERSVPFAGQTKIVNVNDMPWQQAGTPGIQFKVLYRDEKTGASTLLLHFEPGAKNSVASAHRPRADLRARRIPERS